MTSYNRMTSSDALLPMVLLLYASCVMQADSSVVPFTVQPTISTTGLKRCTLGDNSSQTDKFSCFRDCLDDACCLAVTLDPCAQTAVNPGASAEKWDFVKTVM